MSDWTEPAGIVYLGNSEMDRERTVVEVQVIWAVEPLVDEIVYCEVWHGEPARIEVLDDTHEEPVRPELHELVEQGMRGLMDMPEDSWTFPQTYYRQPPE